MRILIVASGNHKYVAPFVAEQAKALQQTGNDVLIYLIKGHGIVGYLRNLKKLRMTILQFAPDIIHAHYGLSGLLCTLQHTTPVVVTYHGSDLNSRGTLLLCRLAMRKAAYNIFVNESLWKKRTKATKNTIILPCGIDTQLFSPSDRAEARRQLGLQPDGLYILFSGAFNNKVKNAPLAKEACLLIPNVELLELCDRSRKEVALLMNAADVLLVTSYHEGSPQVVKEALACNLPVVSVDVGDINLLLTSTKGGIISEPSPQAIASALVHFLDPVQRTHARDGMDKYDNRQIASQLCSIYNTIIYE